LDEEPVEITDHLYALLDLISGKAEGEGDLAAVEGEIARRGIDGERDDPLRRLVRHLLDVHAAGLRGDERDPAGGAINERRKVELALDLGAVLDIEPLDDAAGRAGLD